MLLSEEEKHGIRQMEEVSIEGERAQLSDIILRCRNKFEYEQTFARLLKDYEQTLEHAKRNRGRGMSVLADQQMEEMLKQVCGFKFKVMREHYERKWGGDLYESLQKNAGCMALVLSAIGVGLSKII